MLDADGDVLKGAHAGTLLDGVQSEAAARAEASTADPAAEVSDADRVDVFELASVALVIADREGCALRINPAFAQLLGRSREELLGSSFAALTDPDDLDRTQAALRDVVTGVVDTVCFETRYWRPDGSVVWVDLSVRALPGTAGEVTEVLVQGLDITERKALEDQLTGSVDHTKRLATVARVEPSAVIIVDPQGRVEWVNDSFAALTGCPAERTVGRFSSDLAAGPDVESGEFPRFLERALRGEPVGGEFCLQRADGHLFWADVQVRAVIDDGVITNLVGMVRDITAPRRAQDRLEGARARAESLAQALTRETELLSSVIAAVPQMVFWKDDQRRYVDANAAYLTFRGHADLDALRGRTESEVDPSSGFAEILDELEQAVLTLGEPAVDRQVTLPDDTGCSRVLLLSVLPLGHVADGSRGILGVAADVTQVQELERQLAQANRLESIGQLAAGIAHEINTPVQYIAANTAFLADATTGMIKTARMIEELSRTLGPGGPDCDQGHRALAELVGQLDLEFLAEDIPSALTESQEGLTSLTRIVRAMKDYSHPGSELADTDINKALETTVHLTRNEWKYVARIQLDLDPEAGLVPCYAGELKQVILNLLVNAAQALAEQRSEGGDLELGLIKLATRREADCMVITVADDGPGMPESVRRRVFEPFFTTKGVGKGTGQGLSLARAVVVDKHGGRLEVESAPGQGARFTIRLPLHLEPAEPVSI